MTIQTFFQLDAAILLGLGSLGAAFLFSLARLCCSLARQKA